MLDASVTKKKKALLPLSHLETHIDMSTHRHVGQDPTGLRFSLEALERRIEEAATTMEQTVGKVERRRSQVVVDTVGNRTYRSSWLRNWFHLGRSVSLTEVQVQVATSSRTLGTSLYDDTRTAHDDQSKEESNLDIARAKMCAELCALVYTACGEMALWASKLPVADSFDKCASHELTSTLFSTYCVASCSACGWHRAEPLTTPGSQVPATIATLWATTSALASSPQSCSTPTSCAPLGQTTT